MQEAILKGLLSQHWPQSLISSSSSIHPVSCLWGWQRGHAQAWSCYSGW
ncbi:hypothetical protein AVDCRST_MAG94-1251 [uncultured Leptolyngbya sp.]|uniref:Uncharacterized protein n=1 Tax=uncultured Leptolyngbya sp. TaxID=332963 RepID=A0A6J4KVJ8_9CYAN|nr:hypothetical protein AVDCRST_MAG94-1251 [uncultured Leptolyngbya sp.]